MPARLLLLVVVSIVLTFISLGKLRDGWSFSQGGGSPLLSSAAQAGSCFVKYPWIPKALDTFYVHAWAAANASTDSPAEAMERLRKTMWGKYHPGMDEVVLQYSPETERVEMEVVEVSPPNQEHKKRCMLGVLEEAVDAHNDALAALLAGRELRFIVETEDFGVAWRAEKHRLPAFAMCTDSQHSDIPVPDFTYNCYPETRYKNSSWPAIQELLQRKSDMLHWHERHSALFHRSNWGVGPRRGLMPLLQSYANGSAGVSAEEALGVDLDIGDTGFVQVASGKTESGRHDQFVWLDGQCDHKYNIHTAGFSYSAALKYKLACGSLVFKFESQYKEFYEPALLDDVHVVKLPAGDAGVDAAQFKAKSAPRIKEVVQRTLGAAVQPPIAAAGQAFVREQLTPEALHCYWLGALQRYADMYFAPTPTPRAEGGGGGTKGAAAAAAGEAASGAADADDAKRLP